MNKSGILVLYVVLLICPSSIYAENHDGEFCNKSYHCCAGRDLDCESKHYDCVDNACVQKHSPGTQCSLDSECISGKCKDGTCTNKPRVSCNGDGLCPPGYEKNFGSNPCECYLPKTLLPGSECVQDTLMTNDSCKYSGLVCVKVDGKKQCVAPGTAGNPCTNGYCGSGLTCSSGTCVEKAKPGEPCKNRFDCLSNSCGADKLCVPYAGEGESCTVNSSSPRCAPEFKCVLDPNSDPKSKTGHCVPREHAQERPGDDLDDLDAILFEVLQSRIEQ